MGNLPFNAVFEGGHWTVGFPWFTIFVIRLRSPLAIPVNVIKSYQVGEDGSDTDWNMTVRLPEGLPEDFDYSEPVNAVGGKEKENGWGEGGRGSSPVKEEERRARSPGKEVSSKNQVVSLYLHIS